MSTFTAPVGIASVNSHEYVYAEALVDTGTTHSIFPESFLADIHVARHNWGLDIMLADGTITTTPIGQALIQLHGREGICPVLFGSPGVFLIGATTLEFLGLAADRVNKRLIPAVIQGRPF